MTTTTIAPAAAAQSSGKITLDIQQRVVACMDEMNFLAKERHDVIHGMWVARIAQEHLLMLGPGGIGKSLLARALTSHIDGAVYFETAFDETTDPSQVFGPPDIKAMVEDGKTRRVPTGMLPEATDAMLDEFFNGNGPLLHSIMPALNERVFHNNGQPSRIPLRSCLMGTNKLNADVDQAALWDRVHLRYVVQPVRQRHNEISMITEAIARMSVNGRGVATNTAGVSQTMVTLDELDQAHAEALSLDMPDDVMELFLDIKDELLLGDAKIELSGRRLVESMAAVLANAWVRGHDEVKVADLDILTGMWWNLQEQQTVARGVILAATNPGEKAALDLLDVLDNLRSEMATALKQDLDESRKTKLGIQMIRDCEKLEKEASSHKAKALAAGANTQRITEVIDKTLAFQREVGSDLFGLSTEDQKSITNT